MNTSWIRGEIVQIGLIVVAFIGVLIVAGAHRSKFGDNLSTIAVALLGLVFIAIPALLLAWARTTGTTLFG
jgi:hypothetical protein